MRHSGLRLLCLLTLMGVGVAVEVGAAEDAAPSLEYRPPKPVLPEPKAPTPAPPVTLFRESIGSFGIGNGSFDRPTDVAMDADANLYVLDAGNNRIQVFDRFSNFVLATGVYGSREGQFNKPRAIAVDKDGFIYVVDTGNDRIQKFGWVERFACPDCPARPDGLRLKPLLSWGSRGTRVGNFNNPVDIAFDDQGNAFVLDAGNERIQKFDASGRFLLEWGRAFGSREGQFSDLTSIACSDERFGFVYLLGGSCLVQQFRGDGLFVKSWQATVPESGLCVPARIETDNQNDYVYVLDSGNGVLARFNREGGFLAAIRGADRPFSEPGGFSVVPERDQIVVADTGSNIVQKVTLR